MQNINNLQEIGISDWEEIFHNPSYEELFERETDPNLTEHEKGIMTQFDAVNVDTGRFTGRSPKDKYILKDENTEDIVWWSDDPTSGSDNKPISKETWEHLRQISIDQLSGKKLYVVDGFCGANEKTRIAVRLITEVAWQAHFFKNMFIRPSEAELKNFVPGWTILSASKAVCEDFEKHDMVSEVFVAFNISEKTTVIGGTWYGGEIKKGIFTMMNYFLPLRGMGAFHCSAVVHKENESALFFGLSGTGKTTLSADHKYKLIGDDEHGWDDDGIFNFEGGCYAKCIDLSKEKEPDIYNAIKRDALLENLDIDEQGKIDFSSTKKTENTRVSYPIYHIENIVTPVSKGPHATKVIFLTCDAYGVLPPVSKLSREQALYYFLSGYTAKVAGTELGVTEPKATFSSCFGQPFLALHPVEYAKVLAEKIDKHCPSIYLVNTGWVGGKYGVGKRIDIVATRRIVEMILNDSLESEDYETMPVFNLQVPKTISGVPDEILSPRDSWTNRDEYDKTLNDLAKSFTENFKRFTNTELGKTLEMVGPEV